MPHPTFAQDARCDAGASYQASVASDKMSLLWLFAPVIAFGKIATSRLLDNNTLVALTLMIAESRTEEKDVMTKVVVNLINKNN